MLMFVAEALGQEGLQVFIDAGVEVDENLVNALIKEVVEERITSMVGQRTARCGQDALKRDSKGVQSPSLACLLLYCCRDDERMARVPKQKVSETTVAEVQPDVTSVVRKARAPSPVVRSVLQVTSHHVEV